MRDAGQTASELISKRQIEPLQIESRSVLDVAAERRVRLINRPWHSPEFTRERKLSKTRNGRGTEDTSRF